MNYEVIRHADYHSQMSAKDDKAVNFSYDSGSYDQKSKTATLKFKGINNAQSLKVTCYGNMFGNIASLPAMKDYVLNSFYMYRKNHQYLESREASRAAVYLWDIKNQYLGKGNILDKLYISKPGLQHSDEEEEHDVIEVPDEVLMHGDSYQIRIKSVEKDRNRIHVKAEVSGAGGTVNLDYMYYSDMGAIQGLDNYLNGKVKTDSRYNIPTNIRQDIAGRVSRILESRTRGESKYPNPKQNTTVSPKQNTYIKHSYSVIRSINT